MIRETAWEQVRSETIDKEPVILNRAAHVVFLVAGADKAAALAHVLEGPLDPDEYPSQIVQPVAGSFLWLIDDAAAGKLRQGS
jgi:6-phosphogluconolactonase